MKKFVSLFTDSAQEFKHVSTIAVCGLMAALAIVLKSFSIPLGETIKLGFSGLPNEVVDYLFGPVLGSIFAAALDVLKFLIRPTGAYFPGFTISAFLAGLIYGVFLYKKPISFWRILLAKALVAVFVNILLNTLWISMLYGKAFLPMLPPRILKNLLEVPVDTLLLFLVLRLLEKVGIFRMVRNSASVRQSKA